MLKKIILSGCAAAGILLCLLLFAGGMRQTEAAAIYAAAELPASDGTYAVSVSNDMPMGGGNLSGRAVLEKAGDTCYLSLSFNTAKLENPRLVIDGKKAGYLITGTEADHTTYCYTLSAENILRSLPFEVYVVPMKADKTMRVTVDLASAEMTGDLIADIGERPAEFVPVLTANAGGEYTLRTGTAFVIPSAAATLGGENCRVDLSAYYIISSAEREPVALDGNRLFLEKEGEYRVVYRASSPQYRTSAGADTYTTYEVTIYSRERGDALVRMEDADGVLPADAVLQASRITAGTLYETAADKMKEIADRFEVFSVDIYAAEGNSVSLAGNIRLYLPANEDFETSEIEVYLLMEDGRLGSLSCTAAEGYAVFETNVLGTFIVCEPGVAFVMPMWGYAAIVCAAAAALITVAIAIPLVLKKRRKKTAANRARKH